MLYQKTLKNCSPNPLLGGGQLFRPTTCNAASKVLLDQTKSLQNCNFTILLTFTLNDCLAFMNRFWLQNCEMSKKILGKHFIHERTGGHPQTPYQVEFIKSVTRNQSCSQ